MNWWKRRRLRIAREKYAYWKARLDALERYREVPSYVYEKCSANAAKYEERVVLATLRKRE